MTREKMCERFAAALARAGMTQTEMAAAAGVARSTVNRTMRGTMWPSCEMLEVLARRGISAHWLITGEDPPAQFHSGDAEVDRLCTRILSRGGPKMLARLRGYLEALENELDEVDVDRRTA